MEEKIYKFKVKFIRRFYPKKIREVETGSWQINRVEIVEPDNSEGFEYNSGEVSLVGNQVFMREDDSTYLIHGKKTYNEQYKEWQYEVTYSQEYRPLESENQKRNFLSLFLTDRQIEEMYKAIDDPFTAFANEDIESLCKVKGVGNKTAIKMINRYLECKDCGGAHIELISMGLTPNMVQKLVLHYKSPDVALTKIKDNPYILADEVKGIGFSKADEIAHKFGIPENDPRTVKAYILYHFETIGENGHTYSTLELIENAIVDQLGLQDLDLLDNCLGELIDSGKVIHIASEESDVFALKEYYTLEKEISYHIHRLLGGDNNIQLNREVAMERIKQQEKRQGWEFTEQQLEGVFAIADSNVTIIRGYAGCVDCDTEYFNGREWKRIADYAEGEQVLQYNKENGKASLTLPIHYIKQKNDTLYYFETKQGLNQCLSDNHRMLLRNCNTGELYDTTMREFKEKNSRWKDGVRDKTLTTFSYEATNGEAINLTHEELRVMVAVFADGHFNRNTPYCRISLKKTRKIERMEKLLKEANIEYRKVVCEGLSEIGYTKFYFIAPLREKHFPKSWLHCTEEEAMTILDELKHWDSHIGGSSTNEVIYYCTTNKEDADFVQFLYHRTGIRATISIDKRLDDLHKNICYTVSTSKRVELGANKRGGLKVEEYKTKDGYEYCFEVPSTYLVLRRNNKIFITGNCGKTASVIGMLSCLSEDYSVTACALSGKAGVNISDSTEGRLQGYTIHRLLKYNPAMGGFAKDENDPLDYHMIILDETSMVDAQLFLNLIKAIPTGSKLVMLGDTNQLESIGIGNVMMDLIDSEIVPCITFDKIHRQGAKSGIIPFSIEVAQGKRRYKDSWVGEEVLGELQDLKMIGFACEKGETKPSIDLIIREFKEMYKECKDISKIGVVLPTKSSGTSCYKVNQLIQDIVLPPRRRGQGIELGTKKEPYAIHRGDKVINLKNNYKTQPNIFNGNMGEVISVDIENESVVIDFYNIGEVEVSGKDLESIDLGYAITTHKSQGSSIPYLIYCVDYSHFTMLNRQQVYTGITRAKKKCSFIFETKALNKAIRTNNVKQKRTFLYHMLLGEL